MENNQFKDDAKQMVDLMFNSKVFKEEVTRDDMNKFEEVISFLLSSRFESHLRCQKLMKQIESHKEKT